MTTDSVFKTCMDKTWFYPYVLANGECVPSAHDHALDAIHHTRTHMLHAALDEHFAENSTSLTAIDLACHQGWFAVELAKRGFNRVLATDARAHHTADTRLISEAYQLQQYIDTLTCDVHALDSQSLGQFDLVLCLGLIYHLENPIGALRKAHALCKQVCIIETQIAPGQTGLVDYGSHRFVKPIEASFVVVDETYETHGPEASTLGISLIPDLNGLIWILKRIGFKTVKILPAPENAYEQLRYGKRVMLAAYVS
jgi:tRNA (mo5U34)-methyltransferase